MAADDEDMLELAKSHLIEVLERRQVVSVSLWRSLCKQAADGDADLTPGAIELERLGAEWRASKGLASALDEWVVGLRG